MDGHFTLFVALFDFYFTSKFLRINYTSHFPLAHRPGVPKCDIWSWTLWSVTQQKSPPPHIIKSETMNWQNRTRTCLCTFETLLVSPIIETVASKVIIYFHIGVHLCKHRLINECQVFVYYVLPPPQKKTCTARLRCDYTEQLAIVGLNAWWYSIFSYS